MPCIRSCTRPTFLLLRCSLALLWTGIVGYGLYRLDHLPYGPWGEGGYPFKYFFIKLTNWAGVLQLLYLWIAVSATLTAIARADDGSSTSLATAATVASRPQAGAMEPHRPPRRQRAPRVVRCVWALQPANVVVQLLVTALYWGLSHNYAARVTWSWQLEPIANISDLINATRCPPMNMSVLGDTTNHPADLTLLAHATNSIVALVDLGLTRQPPRLSSERVWAYLVGPSVISFVYVAFTVLYHLAGGPGEDGCSPFIYTALDWSNFGGNSMRSSPEAPFMSCNMCTVRVVVGVVLFCGVPLVSCLVFVFARGARCDALAIAIRSLCCGRRIWICCSEREGAHAVDCAPPCAATLPTVSTGAARMASASPPHAPAEKPRGRCYSTSL